MATERRRAPRYPLIAAAEIIEPQTNLRFRGRTADLSLVGCYFESRSSLPASTEIRVQIIHNDAIFHALGMIVCCQPNTGVRIKFTDVPLEQHETLQGWLTALTHERVHSHNFD
jgi:PilZ domain